MKKFSYILLIAALMLINAKNVQASNEVYYINRENIEMTEEEYNTLLELGFTEAQIDRMDYDEFESNKDLDATLVAQTEQLVKTTVTIQNGIKTYHSEVVTENQMQQEMVMQSMGPTYGTNISGSFEDGISYSMFKRLTTYIVCLGGYMMRYKMDMQYVTIPSERYYDIIGIAVEPTKVYVASVLIFREDHITTGGTFGHNEAGYTKTETTGGSILFELPSGSLDTLESYIYFNVNKKTGVGTITTLGAYGDYAHAYSSVTDDVYDYYTLNHGSGFVFDNPYGGTFDDTTMAVGTFVGTW